MKFSLKSDFAPAGDQINAIKDLTKGVKENNKNQVLLGVTGSGKTFTMAHVINNLQKPALILAHNKTLAAQLYGEMKSFFPDNAVEYFVSYYDYYQPEAYIPHSDTYIEKDSSINEQIDLLRHSATRSLLERKDVIVISSVSCIYGIGSPELYVQMTVTLTKNKKYPFRKLIDDLVELQYSRNDVEFLRGNFRVRGDIIDIFPAHLDSRAWRISFFGDDIEEISEFDPLTGKKIARLDQCVIYANSHYVTPQRTLDQAINGISEELPSRVKYFKDRSKLVEAQRIEQKTLFDIEMMQSTGSCKGIENYSRYLSGRKAGEAPPTLFEYFPKDALLFIDESHVTVPQIGGMYNGDRARKSNLVEHGFRLPSALDNRPLKFEEWDAMRPNTIFVSATPGKIELEKTAGKTVEQIIRPTGLVDPECFIRPRENQVDDLIAEIQKVIKQDLRILVTTLTKKMAENLAEYLQEIGVNVCYLHSDVKTLERVEIIQRLRSKEIDVLVGVNLLREGLDIPECGLVAILDADKEGFLRSETSLVQTIGRAARNSEAKVMLYADKMTNSLTNALNETNRRREIQQEYNSKHGITPKTVSKPIFNLVDNLLAGGEAKQEASKIAKQIKSPADLQKQIEKLRKIMFKAASEMEFEKAAEIRDEIHELEQMMLV